jgi:3-deoxy-D-manno-octulosonate 8-phosphate phosphatase KdsC-like HAD superfamily phosphatase
MELVGHRYCPKDACRDIKKVCGERNVLSNRAGENVICELVDTLLEKGLVRDCTMKEIEELDKKETF